MLVYVARGRAKRTPTASKTAWWCGENVIIVSISAACPFGLSRIIAAHCVSKSGLYNEWGNKKIYFIILLLSTYLFKFHITTGIFINVYYKIKQIFINRFFIFLSFFIFRNIACVAQYSSYHGE